MLFLLQEREEAELYSIPMHFIIQTILQSTLAWYKLTLRQYFTNLHMEIVRGASLPRNCLTPDCRFFPKFILSSIFYGKIKGRPLLSFYELKYTACNSCPIVKTSSQYSQGFELKNINFGASFILLRENISKLLY